MKLNTRNLLQFVLVLAIVFAVLVAVYPQTIPAYQEAVLTVANPIMEQFSPARFVEAEPAEAWQVHLGKRAGESGFIRQAQLELVLFYIDLLLLPALVLATPIALGRRALLLVAALVLLFAVHVLKAVGFGYVHVCFYEAARVGAFQLRVCGWMQQIVHLGLPIWALLIWGVLAGRSMWRAVVSSDGATS